MFLSNFTKWLSASAIPNLYLSQYQTLLLQSTRKFPWIQHFASIGDSYAAGLGAGDRMDWLCSRYTQSYPNLLHTSLLGSDPYRTHQFLACSGATSTEILEKQIPALRDNLDLLTISAGGNDIGLTPILSNCIYQFYMSAEDSCQQAMNEARTRIANETELYHNITLLIEAAKPKMNHSHGVIYYTGYAGFFGTDDETCDNVTWAVWKDVEWTKQYLKRELRKELNDMVHNVNTILQKAVKSAGPNIRFIDYDAQIEAARGRYCEKGVLEPNPNRLGLTFYEWNTVDTGENKTALQNQTGEDVPKHSFQGDIAKDINKTLGEHPGWQFDPEKGFVNKTRGEVRDSGWVSDSIHWMLPDSYKRVFHLRPEGHRIIAKTLLEDLNVKGPGQRAA